MMSGKRNRVEFFGARHTRRAVRTVASGLVVALSTATLVGLGSVGASAEPVNSAPVVSAENITLALKAPKVTVTKVSVTSTPTSSGTKVRATVRLTNDAPGRKPALFVRLYLTNGDTKFKLGDVPVKSLGSRQSTTVTATRTASLKAAAGRYSVLACRGHYSTQKCRTSAATVTIEPARLISSAAVLDLGDVAVGSTSPAKQVIVKNRGHATTGAITASVSSRTAFSITSSTCGPSLNPGASCKVSLDFAPGAADDAVGSLVVSGTRVAPLSIALAGTGLEADLTIDRSEFAFDDTVVGSASTPTEFTVTNPGNLPTGIAEATLGSESGGFEITASSCDQVLAPAATCTVAVAFTPTAAGERDATLFVSATPGGSVSTDLTGLGLAPASFSSDPETLVFGDELIGETTDTQTVTITNDGDLASGLPAVVLDGEDADQFTIVDSDCTTVLTAGASCDIEITFAPTASGVASAVLAVTGAPGEEALAALGGVGQTEAALAISETTYDFGYISSPVEHTFTVTNDGDATSGNPVVELDGSGAFDITTDTCAAPLPGGVSCTVGVTYTGSGSSKESAELSVTASPGATVTAEVTGFPLALTVTPTSHDYGGVPVGGSSAAKSFTVTNHRLAPVQITGQSVSGPFVAGGGCFGAVLPANGTCTFTASFAPSRGGSASGSIGYSAQGASVTVAVSGTGLTPAAFAVNPSALAFGAYAPGDTGTRQVTITNTGTQASNTISFTISGTDSTEFTTQSADCPTVLAGGASCIATIAFAPTTLGDKTATLSVAGAPGGTVSLTASAAPAGMSLASYDWGTQAVGSSTLHTFRLVNTTNVDQTVDMVSIGTGRAFSPDTADFTCVRRTTTLKPHEWCTIGVRFTPATTGSFTGQTIASGAFGSVTAEMLGTAVEPTSSARSGGTPALSSTRSWSSVQLRDGELEFGFE